MLKPRDEVIRRLADEALEAMKACPIEDLQVSEIISACFTLCRHCIETVITQSDALDIGANRQSLEFAIMALERLLHPGVN